MEVGDFIYCHTTGYYRNTSDVFALEDKSYEILGVYKNRDGSISKIFFRNEEGYRHQWGFNNDANKTLFYTYFSLDGVKRNSWNGNVLKFHFV